METKKDKQCERKTRTWKKRAMRGKEIRKDNERKQTEEKDEPKKRNQKNGDEGRQFPDAATKEGNLADHFREQVLGGAAQVWP